MGRYLIAELSKLQPGAPFLGDVRGLGLMVGIEVVRSAAGKEHAPVLARWIKERMKVSEFAETGPQYACSIGCMGRWMLRVARMLLREHWIFLHT